MATSIVKSIELDFAEFASTLISDTLTAIITTAIAQEKQIAELEQEAMLTPQEYAKDQLTDNLIREEILRLFPSNAGGKSSVDKGEPYTGSITTLNSKSQNELSSINEEEYPLINKKTGYIVTNNDIVKTSDKFLITDTGYKNIFEAVKIAIANKHLSVLRQMFKRGIPRVYVNNGHIKSKLTLNFEQTTITTATKTVGLPRFTVQPIKATDPAILTLSGDVLSEIEISFKTVIP
ncbi:MAG: hypothetical protein LBE76_04510 [Nitrososphaerota archaeon]|jgi:hypothetical protein|nr:hypothetical protein [Nitrososphaerota archaeon]